MSEFRCRTKIICGSGAVSQLKQMKPQRLFLVTDPYFAQNGVAQSIAKESGAAVVEIFQDVMPDPSVQAAAKGAAAVKAFEPDLLVALGGGSAMDCAKAMAYFSGCMMPFVAIPTTSGSGSEVTDFAILTHENTKHPLVDDRLLPDVAILDDTLLEELPRSLIADTGFDVLAHCVEGWGATGAAPMSDALAKEAFCTALEVLPASFEGCIDVRLRMHAAATMAGMAFSQAGLGLCHAMAHVLGGMYHVPHGRLNAILLPAVIECNAVAAAQKYQILAQAAQLGGSAKTLGVRNLKQALCRLRKQLHMPQTLTQCGISREVLLKDAGHIVSAVLEDPCCQTNPRKAEPDLVRQVLESVTGNG